MSEEQLRDEQNAQAAESARDQLPEELSAEGTGQAPEFADLAAPEPAEEDLLSETAHEESSQKTETAAHKAYEWVEWAASVVVCVVLILTFAVRTVGVHGISMEPTLQEGDRLLATRIGGSPKAGTIVAITQPNSSNIPLIKRVIATEGQTIDIDFDSGDVTVDGVLLDEPYINERITRDGEYDLEFPLTVPDGRVFCMGDNRNHSWDSRASDIGMIDDRYILGKVLIRFAPLDNIGRP